MVPSPSSGRPPDDDRDLHGAYAGLVSRGLAWALDIAVVSLASILVFWVISMSLSILGVPTKNCPNFVRIVDLDSFQNNICRVARAGEYGLSLLLPPTYFIVLWWLGGQTIGMGIFGIRVVRVDGSPLPLQRSALRFVILVLAILPMGLGVLWALVDERRQTWHDKIARTYVIYWRQPRVRRRPPLKIRPTVPSVTTPGSASLGPPDHATNGSVPSQDRSITAGERIEP